MFTLNRRTRIYVSKDPSDMRASYDTLFEKTKKNLEKDPFSGHLFVFMNRRRSSCKCLYYDGTGLVIIAKRLEKGTFAKMNPHYPGQIVLTSAEFALLFEGADINKRFIDSPREIKKSSLSYSSSSL